MNFWENIIHFSTLPSPDFYLINCSQCLSFGNFSAKYLYACIVMFFQQFFFGFATWYKLYQMRFQYLSVSYLMQMFLSVPMRLFYLSRMCNRFFCSNRLFGRARKGSVKYFSRRKEISDHVRFLNAVKLRLSWLVLLSYLNW